MAKKYHNIGSMIEKRDKGTNEPVLDENGKRTYYIKIDKQAKIVINGSPVTGYINISRPRDRYDRMLASGKITQKEHAEKIARFEKDGDLDYISFELTATSEN